jgi:VWFA-related protein
MRSRWLAAAVVVGLASWGLSAGAVQDQPPRIRSGVELVTVDVQVVDGRGRPVTDLGPGDFEVTIGGRRRPVVSAELVDYGTGERRERGAAVAPAAPVDIGEAERPRRMYVIAVDEHSIRFGAARAAMEAARRFIARLEPDDLVGLYAYPTGTAQVDLTTDHAAVVSALDRVTAMFDMPRTRYNVSPAEAIDIANQNATTLALVRKRECRGDAYCNFEIPNIAREMVIGFEMTLTQSLGGLRGLVAALGEIPGRKILVLVSGGLMMTDAGGGRVDETGRIGEIGALAARTNTTLYALHMDTKFQDAFLDQHRSLTIFRDEGMFMRGLDLLAGSAGGTVFRLQTGSGDPAFDRVLLETSAHYLLGVEAADEDRDGRPRNIRVTVPRRGTTVRSRSSVIIPPR